MDFTEEVRRKTLEKLVSKREKINEKILKIDNEQEIIKKQELINKVNELSNQQIELKQQLLDNKEYNLYSLYQQYLSIEKNILRFTRKFKEYNVEYSEILNELGKKITEEYGKFEDEEREIYNKEGRKKFIPFLEKNNEEIIDIENETDNQVSESSSTQKKSGIFNRFLSMFSRKKVPQLESPSDEKIFMSKFDDIDNFFSTYALMIFSENTIDELQGVHNLISSKVKLINMIKNYIRIEGENEQDKKNLEDCEPHEYWFAAEKFMLKMRLYFEIAKKMKENENEIKNLYKQKSDNFKLENLSEILSKEENIKKQIQDLENEKKETKKQITSISDVIMKGKQEIVDLKQELKELEKKEKNIKKADLKGLGYLSKIQAAQKLGIELNDYLIIPINSDIKNISNLFNKDELVNLDFDGKTYKLSYRPETAVSEINSVNDIKENDAVLMVSLSELTHNDIDGRKGKKIYVNNSVLNIESSVLILPRDRKIELDGYNFDIRYSRNKCVTQDVESLLDDNYKNNVKEVEKYDVIKKINKKPIETLKKKFLAVKKFLFQNISKDIRTVDSIVVDGENFSIDKQDEFDMMDDGVIKIKNEKEIHKILKLIQNCKKIRGSDVDKFYGVLCKELLESNKKLKAEYYDETKTDVMIKNRKLSIKPDLNFSDDTIIRKYTRKNEDVVYKTMKLANLVNRFAHMADDKSELQNKLFKTKLDLIEKAIDMSEGNKNIMLYKKFDEAINAHSVIVEIPGYNMVALHAINKSESLSKKINGLEEYKYDHLGTSAIMYPGVNSQLLYNLKKMSAKERQEFVNKLDGVTLRKLAIRMGIINQSDEENFKRVSKKIMSDDDIDLMLDESDEGR